MSAPLTAPEGTTLLRLARASIVDRLLSDDSLERCRGGERITPALEEHRGAFVTLHVTDDSAPDGLRLRGCVGTMAAREPLYLNVIHNAVHSAFDDPRFPALDRDELQGLAVEISALTPLRPVDGPDAIVPGRDGVHLRQGDSSAVFLPQVAVEQGWDVPELLANLALKAGLPRDGWAGGRIEIFRAEVFAEGDF